MAKYTIFGTPKTWYSRSLYNWMMVLFIIELAGTVAALALFGIASPDNFRTDLWIDGGKNHFNSNPNDLIYLYANYRPIPATPLVWSSL
jgi:hypothetical protein